MRLRSKLRSSTSSAKLRKRDGHTFEELHLDAVGHLLGDLVGDSRVLVMLRAGTPLALDGAPWSIFTTRIKLLGA